MTDPTSKSVATRSGIQTSVVDRIALPRTLMGGTKAMRAAHETYLPKEKAESEDSYKSRINRSVLFNAFGKTVKDMTGKVFDKPVQLKDNVPEKLKAYAEDIDLAGTHFNVFACEAFKDGMQTGGGYFLTDMPQALPAGATLADEQRAGNRPYLVYIPVERMLGWKSERIGGVETLTQIRFRECVTEADGEFLEKEVEQIRVIDRGVGTANCTWRTFRISATDKDVWVQVANGETSLPKITLAPFYAARCGFMTFEPPLESLAELNVTHWQSSSDQRNIVHVARVPILFWAGKKEGDTLTIGAGSAVYSSDANAKLGYVEHTGQAIKAGQDDLDKLEDQMQAMGLMLLVDKPGQTATGEIRDSTKENSPLAMMATSLGDALELSLGFIAEYDGLGADAGGEVEVNKDFGIRAGAGVDVPNLITMRANGEISRTTFWSELKRRGLLSDSFDPDTEAGLLDKEAEAAPELDSGKGKGMDLNDGGGA